MNKTKRKDIYVYFDAFEGRQPVFIGALSATASRGKEVFSFEYDSQWLNQKNRFVLDPALDFLTGHHYAPLDQSNFGIFLDSSPDRWGRFLMNRREALLAREEVRPEKRLLESDYLLGVHDEHRMGAIRFRLSEEGPFLDNNKKLASPPMASLRELEQASLAIEKKDAENNQHYHQWLNMLIAPGGSLGGARPKASVVDEKNQLWIAKFPSRMDEFDVGAWEMLAYRLGVQSGLVMSDAKLKRFNSENHTFLTRRFDRLQGGARVHFASAMTMLQRKDGDDASMGVSYLELAEFIERQGANVIFDLEQLWRRILFSVCISNVDDHLRNHGFLLSQKGWVLSPAFDINPQPYSDGLKLNISETDNTQSIELVKSVAPYFRLSKKRSGDIVNEMVGLLKQWRREATRLGISASEQEKMVSAFRLTS
jgi:serine/threonine-protein kinase HipA